MCGRYAFTGFSEELIRAYDIEQAKLRPRYNIGPTQYAPVVLADPETGKPVMQELYWGLVPKWAKDKKIGVRSINARAETVDEKPTFKSAFRHHRCLVPATGFYEWKREGKTRTPYYFTPSHAEATLVFAGLWEEWNHRGETLWSFTILTTEPNHLMKLIHDRMPVILSHRDWKRWLDPKIQTRFELEDLLHPCHDDYLQCWEVNSFVNNVRNDGPECVKKLE